MKTSIFAFAAVNAQFNETDITGRNNYAPEEGCPEGHVENNDGFCVQDLPCTHPHTCAYDATCIAGANSWEATCTCNDGFIGDGRYCRVPEGCDEGAGDDGCDCVVLDVQYVNITAAWNDTETCYYEVNIAESDAEVGSWRMELDFDTPVAIKDVWRANYVTNDNFSVTFRPKFYNINSVGPLNFHVTSENTNSCNLYDPPTVTTCTSVYTPTLPTFTPIEEVVNNVEECVEASVNLQHGWVQEDGIRKNNVLIQAGTDLSIKEWYIRLNYNDPSIVTSVTVYNTQLDLDSGYEILSAMEYNKNLYAGTHTWTGIICSDDEGLSLTADLCYIKYD
jgi:hypothetical protein